MDDLLRKYKTFFIVLGVTLGVLALWQLSYVVTAMQATGDSFLLRDYGMLALGLVMLALLVAIVLLCLRDKYPVIAVWAVAFTLLVVADMRVFPGLSAPDEQAHYISAYYLSDQLMFQQADNELGRVVIRETDKALEDVSDENDAFLAGEIPMTEILGHEMREKTYRDIHNWDAEHPEKDGMTVSNLVRVETTPLAYLPQAIGITLARLLHLNSLKLIAFGKIGNLIAFLLMVIWAVRRTPRGKNLMMASTLLPMTIHLAGSMSYDVMIIGCAYMFLAEILYVAYAAQELTWKDIIFLTVILAVMSPCKMVYGILILLLLLIPKEKAGRKLLPLWLLCGAAVVIPVLLVNLRTIGTYTAATTNNLVWAGEQGFTMSYCLHHPLQVMQMVYESVLQQGEYYYSSMLGGYLGNGDAALTVPFLILAALTVGLILLAFAEKESISIRDRIIIGITFILLFGLLLGSMLVGWTPLSSPVILGVQGRYFLPMLPVLLLLIPNRMIKLEKDPTYVILSQMVACDAFALFRLYSVICLQV